METKKLYKIYKRQFSVYDGTDIDPVFIQFADEELVNIMREAGYIGVDCDYIVDEVY